MKKVKGRKNHVAVYLSNDEVNTVDKSRFSIGQSRSAYLRRAAMGCLPPVIPSINRQVWQDLARLAANLNQYQKSVNSGTIPPDDVDLPALVAAVQSLRAAMIGVAHEG